MMLAQGLLNGQNRSDVSVADNATISHENAPKFDQALAVGEHDSENVTTRHPACGSGIGRYKATTEPIIRGGGDVVRVA